MYNLFISHSWTYHNEYERLVNLLNNVPYFNYKNYSVPKDSPIHSASTQFALKEAIERQMRPAYCVLILAGVYSTYSKWINIEIELAKKLNKKIIAINPWSSEKTSSIVKREANTIVGWNTNSIVKAIRGN